MIDNKVRAIVSSLSLARSDDFFTTIVQALAAAIDADHTFVAAVDSTYTTATTIAYDNGGQLAENFQYHLDNTPCAKVACDTIGLYNGNVQEAYPDDQILVDMGVNSYVGTPLKDSQGKVQGLLIALYQDSIEDIHATESLFLLFSGLIAGELERRINQRQINISQAMIDALSEGVLLTNERSEIIYANPAFTNISGYSLEESLGQTPGSLLKSGLHDESFYQAMWYDLNTKGNWSGEILNRKKSGETYTEWLILQRFTEPESQNTHYIAIFHDMSDLKQAQQQLQMREHYDLLTDLPNRSLLLDRIEQQLLLAKHQQQQIALLNIDLDNFRDINIAHGQAFGDKLLQKVSRRLSQLVRQSDTLARIGGDEFALLVPLLNDTSTLEAIALYTQEAMRAPFFIDKQVISISASIGLSVYPDDASDTLDLMAKADQAANHAKQQGKDSYHFFTPELQQRSNRKIYLNNALSKALVDQTLEVHFQPIVDLDKGTVDKAEALVRWTHNGEYISPAEFIPIAEEFGLAEKLGHLVLIQACQQVRAMEAAGIDDVTIAVNRSIAEFPQRDYKLNDWLNQIRAQDVDCAKISFEITESILAPEHKSFTDYLSHLKQAGCSISLDDFGTGYSSLSYVHNFPIDHLKIDRSFVTNMEKNSEALTLVSTIIAMAKALGMKTIAEGVENAEQLALLRELGCNYIQGFLFSKPLVGKQLIEFVNTFSLEQPEPA